jgi:hypothetical protein
MAIRRISHLVVAALVFGTVAGGASATAVSGPALAAWHRPIIAVGASQSNNWSGYNQGTLEQNGKLFTSISADWVVPTATPHTAGEAEYSSTWIGIGGGCVNADCSVTDSTLIQAGTEQDVDASGAASYSAWYELIPAPSITIDALTVHAGDHIHVRITEGASGVWTFVVRDRRQHQSFTLTVPYSSTHATAEWIEETPVVVDDQGNVSVGPLPKLSKVHIDHGKANGQPAGLKGSEEVQLVDFNNVVLATPSRPDPGRDGFNVCSYSTHCARPAT